MPLSIMRQKLNWTSLTLTVWKLRIRKLIQQEMIVEFGSPSKMILLWLDTKISLERKWVPDSSLKCELSERVVDNTCCKVLHWTSVEKTQDREMMLWVET